MYRYSSSSKQHSFRSTTPIDDATIARYAPSVFASEAHASRGERYAFIPTVQVLDGLRAEGFQPFEVRQTATRDVSKREHTRHLIRLRHPDAIEARGEVPELILLNSHDGSSAYKLLAGIFRMVCENGLIAGTMFDDVTVRHTGKVVDDVIEGSFTVLKNVNSTMERIQAYKAVTLSDEAQINFAEAALALRWNDKAPIHASQVLRVTRTEDRPDDLWTVFNRVQENLVRGGLRGYSDTGRRLRTRAVSGINEDVKLNRGLWDLADALAEHKIAA